MTDQPKTLSEAFAPLVDHFRTLWEDIKPIAALLAESAETRAAAQDAIGHAYDEEDERLAAVLDPLDVEQLRDVATAAALLAEQASARHAALTTIPEETDQ